MSDFDFPNFLPWTNGPGDEICDMGDGVIDFCSEITKGKGLTPWGIRPYAVDRAGIEPAT